MISAMADHHESYMLNSTPMYPSPGGVHYPSPAHQHPYPPPGAYHYTGGKPQPPTATYPANTSVVVQPATHVHRWVAKDNQRPWASCQMRKIAGCACAGKAGNVFPNTV